MARREQAVGGWSMALFGLARAPGRPGVRAAPGDVGMRHHRGEGAGTAGFLS